MVSTITNGSRRSLLVRVEFVRARWMACDYVGHVSGTNHEIHNLGFDLLVCWWTILGSNQ